MKFRVQAGESGRIAQALMLMLALLLAVPGVVAAQDSPFGESDFVSPKFGTTIEWTDEWMVDPENSSIQVRRDVLGLISANGEDAVLIELQSQRSFRTGAEYINAALQTYSRLSGFEILEDAVDSVPPSTVFTFELTDFNEVVAGYIQSQPIEGATMVVIVLSLLETLDAAKANANDEISVNGVPLLEALPICGDEDAADEVDAGDSDGESNKTNNKVGSKTDSKTGSGSDSSSPATCVEMFQSSSSDSNPTPTPESQQGRSDSFKLRSWSPQGFPDVSVSYDRTNWTIDQEFAAAENNGRDGVIIFHNEMPTYVIVEVFDGFNGRAGACIDVALQEAGISPGTDEMIADADGNPIQGSQQGRVWAAYSYDLETDDGTAEIGGYVECRALPGASGVLIFTMVSGIGDFEESFENIQHMLTSIKLG